MLADQHSKQHASTDSVLHRAAIVTTAQARTMLRSTDNLHDKDQSVIVCLHVKQLVINSILLDVHLLQCCFNVVACLKAVKEHWANSWTKYDLIKEPPYRIQVPWHFLLTK
jgi:hypothetical protein